MVKALSPKDVAAHKAAALPPAVLKVWNDLIARRWTGSGSLLIGQEDAIAALLSLTPDGSSRQHIFDNGWLDIEPVYAAAGWKVAYDKPAYNESYEASFTFRAAL